MWKDYFKMTNKERSAILTLLCIVIIIQIVISLIPDNSFSDISKSEIEQFKRDIARHEASLKQKKSHKYANYDKTNRSEISVSLSVFDPNTADSASLMKLGFKPFHIRMILRYRQKGGKFRKPEDIARIPYLDKAFADKLIPYINIHPEFAARRDTSTAPHKPLYTKQFKYTEGTQVDVASADTTELKKVPGIGSGMASAIVNYRTRLGGFYTTEQLKEIKCITEDCYTSLCKFLIVKKPVISPIPVNKTGIEKLNAHPYLNFYQAKAIVELRRKKGSLKNLKELSLFEEFSEKDFARLSHYLDFSL